MALPPMGASPLLGPFGTRWRGARQRSKSEATAALPIDPDVYNLSSFSRSANVFRQKNRRSQKNRYTRNVRWLARRA